MVFGPRIPMSEVFCFELSDYPPALFSNGMMKDSGKDRFSNELCKQCVDAALVDKSTVIDPVIVWDGDILLYSRIRTWKRGGTLGQTVEEYNSILQREARTASEKVVPVFDGYLQNTPKDDTHKKRVPVRELGMSIRPELRLDIKADMFLSNSVNKQGFIYLLCDTITSTPSCSKIELRQCEADADTEIQGGSRISHRFF